MNTVMMYIGYTVTTALMVAILILVIDFRRSTDDWSGKFSLFKFGVLWTDDDTLKGNLCKLRKDDNAGLEVGSYKVFFTAPYWFNKHVRNLGGQR